MHYIENIVIRIYNICEENHYYFMFVLWAKSLRSQFGPAAVQLLSRVANGSCTGLTGKGVQVKTGMIFFFFF